MRLPKFVTNYIRFKRHPYLSVLQILVTIDVLAGLAILIFPLNFLAGFPSLGMLGIGTIGSLLILVVLYILTRR